MSLAAARLSRNTLTLMVSNVGGAALSFVLSALIGRALGDDGLGTYAVALAWIYPLNLLVEFGLATLMTRDLAGDVGRAPAYLHAVMLARLVMGGVVMLALIALAPALSDDPRIIAGIHISAPLVIILPMYSAFTAVYRAHGTMRPIPYLNIGMLASQVALTLLVLFLGYGVLAALVVNTVTSAGQLIAAYVIYRRAYISGDDQLAPHVFILLRRALPFALAAVFAAAQSRLSLILLDNLTITAEAGYFTAASRFIEAARMIPNALFASLLPALTALAVDPPRLARTFHRSLLALGGYGVACMLGLALLASFLIPLVFGDDFTPAIPTLTAFSLALPFALLRGGYTLYWYAIERESKVNVVNLAVIAVQGALSLWLIPQMGAVGAAWALVGTEALALVLLWRRI